MNTNNPDYQSITDETIMAYLDGELARSSQHALEEAIQNDSDLRNKVEQYRQNDLKLLQSLSAATETAMPVISIPRPVLEKTSMLTSITERLRNILPKGNTHSYFKPALAFYTLAMLGLGIAIGNNFPVHDKYFTANQRIFERMQVVSAAINMALEQELSGARYDWSNIQAGINGGVTPLKTWKNEDNIYCREFKLELTSAKQNNLLTATACRLSAGYWKPSLPISQLLLNS